MPAVSCKKLYFHPKILLMLQTLTLDKPYTTESGYAFPSVEIGYHIYGSPRDDKPVVWVCHALTGNSDPLEWWPNLCGPGRVLDPRYHTIVCANVLGSCYGTTGATSVNPETGKPYLLDFPLITVRDMVQVNDILRKQLGINRIDMVIGGSLGAFQGLEWSIMEPELISHLVFIAAGARTSPWCKAFNEAQRMALEADPTFLANIPEGGKAGLRAARAIGMISYRSFEAFEKTQFDPEEDKMEGFNAPSYLRYQGNKLVNRYSPYAYLTITRAFDSHDVGRHRGGVKKVLNSIRTRVHCVSIETDILFPVHEVMEVAAMIPKATHHTIQSLYGHDGFLVEKESLEEIIYSTGWEERITREVKI